MSANRSNKGKFIKGSGRQAAEEVDLVDLLESADTGSQDLVRPVVTRIPPNFRLVLCDVGPHKLVRVMVRPNNYFYIPRMVIPMDVDLTNFDPTKLLIYNGNPPIRKGQW